MDENIVAEKMSAHGVCAVERILAAEELACKKARAYANTLTDAELAAEMDSLAEGHRSRFLAVLAAVGEE